MILLYHFQNIFALFELIIDVNKSVNFLFNFSSQKTRKTITSSLKWFLKYNKSITVTTQ